MDHGGGNRSGDKHGQARYAYDDMLTLIAAIVFAALAGFIVLFQVALTLGAPWAEFTLGGKHRGPLPKPLRVVPAVSAVLLLGFAAVVLSRAGVAFVSLSGAASWLVWVVVVYFALGSVLNAITPSRRERLLWLPVVLAGLVTSLVVALS